MSAISMHRRRYRGSGPGRRMVGWGIVIAVHAVVLWALMTGTARRGLELIRKPLEAALIQEVIIPPPPPPKEIPKPERKVVKAEAPLLPYVPPPEAQPPVSPSAVVVPSLPIAPVAPPVIAPPPLPAPAPPSPSSSRADIGVACPTQVKPQMPRKAMRDGTEGVVKAQALIRDGSVREVTILSGPRVFHAAVHDAMMQYKCVSGPGEALATQEFVFKID